MYDACLRKADMNDFSVTEGHGEIGGNADDSLSLYSSIEFNAIHIVLNANRRTTNSSPSAILRLPHCKCGGLAGCGCSAGIRDVYFED